MGEDVGCVVKVAVGMTAYEFSVRGERNIALDDTCRKGQIAGLDIVRKYSPAPILIAAS